MTPTEPVGQLEAGVAVESWPPMAHVSAAAATGHEDYCPCADCEAHRQRYIRAGVGGVRPIVICADGDWTEICEDQSQADRQRRFWDRHVPQCAPHRISWEPVTDLPKAKP